MKTMQHLATLSLIASLAACSSTNPYLENRMVLEQAMEQLGSGQYEETASTLGILLQNTNAESSDFALQRFFAAYLLTKSHEEACDEPFLSELTQNRSQFELSSTDKHGRKPSRIAHLMAVIYHSSIGRSWYPSAENSEVTIEGENLLPESLEELGTKNATIYMNLCFLAVHSELNFEDRVEEVLQGMSELASLEECEALMDEARFPDELRPWVYMGIFEHQKRRDEANAYRFGIRARETGRVVESFGREHEAEIMRWIQEESAYEFVSPANQVFDPALEGCTVTGTPNLMYEAILKTE